MHSRIGVDYFNRALAKVENGEFFVYNPGSQMTSHFLSFAKSNGLFRLGVDVSDVEEGFVSDLLLFDLALA